MESWTYQDKGEFSAELCSDLISQKLSEFGIVFGKDVVSIKDDDGSDDNEGCNDDNGLVVLGSTETENYLALNFDVYKIVDKVRRIIKISIVLL